MNLSDKLKKIKAVILDIDGVLTDGRIGYGGGSDDEIKFFDVKDGHAIKMLQRGDIKVGIISGRESKANKRRAKELGLDFMVEKALNKGTAFDMVLNEQHLTEEECLYIGDDVIDLPILRRAGVAVCPHDAVEEVIPYVDYHTKANGGRGAIREAAVLLLKEQNKWDSLMQRYLA